MSSSNNRLKRELRSVVSFLWLKYAIKKKPLHFVALGGRYNVSARRINEFLAGFKSSAILKETGIRLFANFRFTLFVPGAAITCKITGR